MSTRLYHHIQYSNIPYPEWVRNVVRKIDDWYYKIRNRFFAKYYRIDIRAMPKGAWWDTDHRMFEVVWQLFEDFVEIELFSVALVCGEEKSALKAAYEKSPKKWQFRAPKDRCPKNSWRRKFIMEYWEWEASLKLGDEGNYYDGDTPDKLTDQAEKAIKLRELYLWWKDVLPNRPDPWTDLHFEPMTFEPAENGLSKLKTGLGHNWTKEQMAAAQKIEDGYEEENTKMTQELIAIRGGLWT